MNVIDCTAREYASHRRMCRGTLGTAIACKSWSRDWGPSRGPGHTKHKCSQEGGSGPSSLRTHCAGGARYCGRKPASRSPFWQSSGGREGVVQLVEGGNASRCMDVAVLGGWEHIGLSIQAYIQDILCILEGNTQ